MSNLNEAGARLEAGPSGVARWASAPATATTDEALVATFLIGGAPRSGTTYLCEALDTHPDIVIARPFIPEPKVFMTPADGPSAYRERYRRFFGPETADRQRGEKTSNYLENAEACERIWST